MRRSQGVRGGRKQNRETKGGRRGTGKGEDRDGGEREEKQEVVAAGRGEVLVIHDGDGRWFNGRW